MNLMHFMGDKWLIHNAFVNATPPHVCFAYLLIEEKSSMLGNPMVP